MSSITSLFQTPEEPPSASPAPSNLGETGAPLLELRTDAGPVYVCPSRWQRVRLQWTFRHFHVLPPQVLSRGDQRLIEKLSHSAVVTPVLPVPSRAVLGVVEKAPSKSLASAPRVVTLKPRSAETPAIPAKREVPAPPTPDLSLVAKQTKRSDGREVSFQQWGALGTLAAVGFTVILASAYAIPLLSRAGHARHPRALSTPIKRVAHSVKTPNLHAAVTSSLPAPATASLPSVEKPKRWIGPQLPALPAGESAQLLVARTASPAPLPALDPAAAAIPESGPKVAPATSERRFISDLPQGHFAHPVVSNGNLVGELQLKALIGPDGSVKEVTVLSGDPKLAEAGIRAVRQWHYTPNQMPGAPAGLETHIKMSFFGEDAVSIATVADGPSSQLK
jgi:hypothetical protein